MRLRRSATGIAVTGAALLASVLPMTLSAAAAQPDASTAPAPSTATTATQTSGAASSTTSSTGSTATTIARPRGPVFGAQFHGLWSSYTDTERNRVLSALARNGVRSVRIDVAWSMLQPNGPHQYDPWGVSMVDKAITMAVRHGLRPLVTLFMTPAWANGGAGTSTLPTHPADFARVARWAAHRWAGKVFAWEIWNEPNSDSFNTGASPAKYAALLKAAYPAIHAGDPKAKVVFGGPSYVDVSWVRSVLAHGALHSFDVMAVHPYMGVSDAPPTTPDDGTEWTMRHVAAMHRMLVNKGRHVHIWFTEFGWSVHPTAADAPNWARGVTAAVQARYLVETVRLMRRDYHYVNRLYWYDDLRGIDSGFNGGYGLVYRDGSASPALQAVRTA